MKRWAAFQFPWFSRSVDGDFNNAAAGVFLSASPTRPLLALSATPIPDGLTSVI